MRGGFPVTFALGLMSPKSGTSRIVITLFVFAGKDRHLSNEYKRDLTWLGVVTIVIVAHALYGIYKVRIKVLSGLGLSPSSPL